jgi:hypothetical protein
MPDTYDVRRFRVSDVQGQVIEATERYLDVEGAIRSGKSYVSVLKFVQLVGKHPGIHLLIARWSESDLDAQLKPLWRDLAAQAGLKLAWHALEQYDEVVDTGARVYLRGLKASENTSRYAKFRGLTLAGILVDQAEELPFDVYNELKGRLSQPGFPHQLIVTPNPPSEGHWLATEFPEDNRKKTHKYIRFTLRDNAINLGTETVEAIEEAYPPGTSQHRRLIEGRRGLANQGEPVYRGYFDRALHVQSVEMDDQVALLESWDFGHSFPCVIWGQRLPWGETRYLGGVMGQNMFLPEFAQVALRYRAEWFTSPLEIRSTCDPAGEAVSNHGVPQRAVDVLREMGVMVTSTPAANHPEKRNYAIQQMAAAMQRRTRQGEAFRVNPRFVLVTPHGIKHTEVLVDAFEAGYVWDDRTFTTTTSPNTRRPKKDGFYDHGMNCCEYMELAFGFAQPTKIEIRKLDAKALKNAQRDTDPYDRLRARMAVGGARRGGL